MYLVDQSKSPFLKNVVGRQRYRQPGGFLYLQPDTLMPKLSCLSLQEGTSLIEHLALLWSSAGGGVSLCARSLWLQGDQVPPSGYGST